VSVASTLGHDAKDRKSFSRRRLLSRDESREWASCRLPRRSRLRKLQPPHAQGERPSADADSRLVSYADPLSLCPLAARRHRSQPLDALAADHARPAPSAALRNNRPHLAGTLQGSSRSTWSSLRLRALASDGLVSPSPVPLGADWCDRVNQALTASELEAVRTCIERGRPFGDPAWTRGTAERFGLLDTLNPRGRPKTRKP